MNNNLNKILIGIIALLLLLSGYLFFRSQSLNTQVVETTSANVDLQEANKTLEADYQESVAQLESMKGQNEELNTLIESQKEELKKQKEKVSGLIWNNKDLSKAKAEMGKMKAQVTKYLAEISKLQEDNKVLTGQNVQLTEEKTQLATDLNTEKESNVQLSNQNAELNTVKEKMTEQNKFLSNKYEQGSAIKVNNISMEGGELEGNKFSKKKRTGKMQAFRVCFAASENLVTPKGSETFYIRIVNPNGETLTDNNQGSGKLTNKANGEEILYSIKGTTEYDNQAKDACVVWKNNNEVKKGDYKVEVYNKGYFVGSQIVKIKSSLF